MLALLSILMACIHATTDQAWREIGRANHAFVGPHGGLVCRSKLELRGALRGEPVKGCRALPASSPVVVHRWSTIPIVPSFAAGVAYVRMAHGIDEVIPVANLLPSVPVGTRLMLCRPCRQGTRHPDVVVVRQGPLDASRLVVSGRTGEQTVSIYAVSDLSGSPIFTFATPISRGSVSATDAAPVVRATRNRWFRRPSA